MGFLAAIKKCLRKYAGFSGRASRPEYWNFVLFIMLGLFVLGVVDTALFGGQVTVRADGVTVQSNGPLGGAFRDAYRAAAFCRRVAADARFGA